MAAKHKAAAAVSMTARRKVLMVMAKAPVVGEVKTRLFPNFTHQQATAIHRELIVHTLSLASSCQVDQVQLWCAGEHPFFDTCDHHFPISRFHQRGVDLGQRMANAFDDVLEGNVSCVMIGTDCVSLDEQSISQAFSTLEKHSATIAPAEDGGYVLIGLNARPPSLFDNINWGSDKVFLQQLNRFQLLDVDCKVLPGHWDIDRPEDVRRWWFGQKESA